MIKKLRRLALILAALVLALTFLSSAAVMLSGGHRCDVIGCPVCAVLHALHRLVFALCAVHGMHALFALTGASAAAHSPRQTAASTPVELRVLLLS